MGRTFVKEIYTSKRTCRLRATGNSLAQNYRFSSSNIDPVLQNNCEISTKNFNMYHTYLQLCTQVLQMKKHILSAKINGSCRKRLWSMW